jgi:chemotaxis protein CheY-P-specific phosphatase CheC
MSLEITPRRSRSESDLVVFNRSFISELNIYNQASLFRDSAIQKIIEINKTPNHMGVLFRLEGELKGNILCLIDIEDKEFSNQEIVFFQSLFMESMNILLGKFLTNLEDESGIMSVISTPKIIKVSDTAPNIFNKAENSRYHFATNYLLQTLKDTYQCKIYFVADLSNIKEV